MTEDQILFSLMQWWLSVSAGLFAALQLCAGKFTAWFVDFMLYASLALGTHLLVMLTRAFIG